MTQRQKNAGKGIEIDRYAEFEKVRGREIKEKSIDRQTERQR